MPKPIQVSRNKGELALFTVICVMSKMMLDIGYPKELQEIDVQRNVFRSLILKYFGTFKMRLILGHAKSPKWAYWKAISLLAK